MRSSPGVQAPGEREREGGREEGRERGSEREREREREREEQVMSFPRCGAPVVPLLHPERGGERDHIDTNTVSIPMVLIWYQLEIWDTHGRHVYTRTYSLSLSLSVSLSLHHPYAVSLALSLSLCHPYAFSLSLSLSLNHPYARSLSLSEAIVEQVCGPVEYEMSWNTCSRRETGKGGERERDR